MQEIDVLVVEDSHISACVLWTLSPAGFEALEASSADEAIQVLEGRSDIHLVSTDVSMPGSMDGIKLSHYIRKRWPPVKLIVVSGKNIVDEGHLPVGARFFSKPYNDSTMGMLSGGNEQHL
ncbi:MAG TPA: response regulator [Bradyrhizobium sp.]|uniref:response regulator n=1 Tax=Bradyrhizobium sp. TaxID=376 RepID=UPI002D0734CB|nr:response regulator [Bradyrhizobium sp.]HXB76911.1 response regulator [Bradyrhizobium sp.]